MTRKLILFPFGGNARESLMSVFAINEKNSEWDSEWSIIGFVDDDRSRHGMECCGIKVLGGRAILAEHPDALVLAVPGSPSSFRKRAEIIGSLGLEKSRFATIIHPSAGRARDAVIGCNTIIMANVVISCGVTIGNHCVILPNTVVSHDSVIGDFCCIGSNVSVSGSVHIGSSCYIGSGTKLREDIAIGAETLVGLGSTVLSDLPAGVVAVGSPARVIR